MKTLPSLGMHYAYFPSSDGLSLAFQSSIDLSSPSPKPLPGTIILLLHGFSGSSAYFTRNFPALTTTKHWIIAADLRGHGASGSNGTGYHVARLAADTRELILHLQSLYTSQIQNPSSAPPLKILGIGQSLGAAVLWTYQELFSLPSYSTPTLSCSFPFIGYIFVDQAPLQNLSPFGFPTWDASRAHKGCFDLATTRAAQRCWLKTSEEAYKGLCDDCLVPLPSAASEELIMERKATRQHFISISRRCEPEFLARLLEDHTSYDHRDTIPQVDVPVLVMVGENANCFPVAGVLATRDILDKAGKADLCRTSNFPSGHWMFWEEAERWDREVVEFAEHCFQGAR